jgi:hypothetical protein
MYEDISSDSCDWTVRTFVSFAVFVRTFRSRLSSFRVYPLYPEFAPSTRWFCEQSEGSQIAIKLTTH